MTIVNYTTAFAFSECVAIVHSNTTYPKYRRASALGGYMDTSLKLISLSSLSLKTLAVY